MGQNRARVRERMVRQCLTSLVTTEDTVNNLLMQTKPSPSATSMYENRGSHPTSLNNNSSV